MLEMNQINNLGSHIDGNTAPATAHIINITTVASTHTANSNGGSNAERDAQDLLMQALLQIDLGCYEKAATRLALARSAASFIQAGSNKASALAQIAKCQVRVGQTEEAIITLAQAMQAVISIEDTINERGWALGQLIIARAEIGRLPGGKDVLLALPL
jgi:hypothetical protein